MNPQTYIVIVQDERQSGPSFHSQHADLTAAEDAASLYVAADPKRKAYILRPVQEVSASASLRVTDYTTRAERKRPAIITTLGATQ